MTAIKLTKLEREILDDRLNLWDCISDATELDCETVVNAADELLSASKNMTFPSHVDSAIVAVLSDAIEGSTMACDGRNENERQISVVIRAGKSLARKADQWIKEMTGKEVSLVFPTR
jgi:hypothetical protein